MDAELAKHVRLSERQWARVSELLARADPAALEDGRVLVNALLEQALTGTSWATLILADPRWEYVQATCARWQALGLLDQLSAVLLVRLGAS